MCMLHDESGMFSHNQDLHYYPLNAARSERAWLSALVIPGSAAIPINGRVVDGAYKFNITSDCLYRCHLEIHYRHTSQTGKMDPNYQNPLSMQWLMKWMELRDFSAK